MKTMTCLRRINARALGVVVIAGLTLGLAPRPAAAQNLWTLSDQNSVIEIDTGSQAVMYDWFVDGVGHLNEISNWYRVGPTGPEQSIHNLIILSETPFDIDGDPGIERLRVVYDDPLGQFQLQIDYAVNGFAPGSGTSGLDEDVVIFNTSGNDLEFHYFEYYDLDLYNSPNNDTTQVVGPNAIEQSDPMTFTTWGFGTNSRHELNTLAGDTLGRLTDPVASNLNDVFPAGTGPVGVDNVTFAVQFSFDAPIQLGVPQPPLQMIPAGGSAVINKTGQLQQVPEPTSAALFALLAGVLGARRRR